MALFAVYRVKNGDNRLHVFFSDIRQDKSVEHLCALPERLWLIKEITEQLAVMGFALEADSKLDAEGELQIFATYAIPEGAGSSADAIRTVCSRHAIETSIFTGAGKGLRAPWRQ